MKALLAIASLAEAATGLLLLVYPPVVSRLLFGGEIFGVGVMMSRIAGISLIGLGVACWPGGAKLRAAFAGMLTYSTLAVLYLTIVGISGKAGVLLWLGVVAHAGMSVLLIWTRWKQPKSPG
jgi:hypothetical protein